MWKVWCLRYSAKKCTLSNIRVAYAVMIHKPGGRRGRLFHTHGTRCPARQPNRDKLNEEISRIVLFFARIFRIEIKVPVQRLERRSEGITAAQLGACFDSVT